MNAALIFVDVGSDPTAPIIRDADNRMTCPDTRKQENCREQTRHELHVPTLVRANRFDRFA